jgi:predicted HicB family RNase H-like nuclease
MSDKYCYTVAWSQEDECYIARVAELPSLAAHGDTQEDALQEVSRLVAYVVQDLEESGEPVPEPFAIRQYSGRFNVRIGSSLHRTLAVEAANQGISLNQLVTQKLSASAR